MPGSEWAPLRLDHFRKTKYMNSELVKKALENSVLGKRADNVVPVFDILLVREKQDTSCRCLISLERLNSAVVRSEFAEVRLGAIVEASKTKRNGEAEKLMAHLP